MQCSAVQGDIGTGAPSLEVRFRQQGASWPLGDRQLHCNCCCYRQPFAHQHPLLVTTFLSIHAQVEQQRNVVVAIDDSEEGLAAVGWVLQHLWRPGDVMHLLHVVPALPAHMSYSLAPGGWPGTALLAVALWNKGGRVGCSSILRVALCMGRVTLGCAASQATLGMAAAAP